MNLLHILDSAHFKYGDLTEPFGTFQLSKFWQQRKRDNRYIRSSSKVELFMYRTFKYLFAWTQVRRLPDSDVELAELNYSESVHFYDVQWTTMLISKDIFGIVIYALGLAHEKIDV